MWKSGKPGTISRDERAPGAVEFPKLLSSMPPHHSPVANWDLKNAANARFLFSTPMSAAFFIVAGAVVLSVLFVFWLIWRAPEGREDREGFHGLPMEKPEAEGEAGGPEVRKVG